MEEDSEIGGLIAVRSHGELQTVSTPNLPQTDTTILARCTSSPKKRGRPKVMEKIDAANDGKRSRPKKPSRPKVQRGLFTEKKATRESIVSGTIACIK
ncbi:unnamed protein product [Dovyalis caffra]|uniref:Uncharacterized protein n=1 Tax=Dovyalis caffra TaxID=77055 RepID=A0AAV1RGL5_9ROSI|nr:unnamed protein product [Dovyalis caffra]